MNNKVFYLLLTISTIIILTLAVFAIAPPNGHEVTQINFDEGIPKVRLADTAGNGKYWDIQEVAPSNDLTFTYVNEKLRLTPGGKLGIGTNNPKAPLETFGEYSGAGTDAANQDPEHHSYAIFNDGATTTGIARHLSLSVNNQPAARLGILGSVKNKILESSLFYITANKNVLNAWQDYDFAVKDSGEVIIPKARQFMATTICGAMNRNFDYGQAFRVNTRQSCNQFCPKTSAPKCVGLILLHGNGKNTAGGACSYTPTAPYFGQGDDAGNAVYCCCR